MAGSTATKPTTPTAAPLLQQSQSPSSVPSLASSGSALNSTTRVIVLDLAGSIADYDSGAILNITREIASILGLPVSDVVVEILAGSVRLNIRLPRKSATAFSKKYERGSVKALGNRPILRIVPVTTAPDEEGEEEDVSEGEEEDMSEPASEPSSELSHRNLSQKLRSATKNRACR